MGTVFFHQLQDHLKSLRLQISLGILLLFFCVNALVFLWKAERLQLEMTQVIEGNAERYEQAETIGDAVQRWYRSTAYPLDTEFIAEAGASRLRTSAWVSARSETLPEASIGMTINALLESYDLVDLTMIVRFALSFLCIVLAYDTVTRERELGTLGLALANPLSRAHLLAGKFLAHLAVLAVSLLLGSLVSLVILSLNGAFELSAYVLGSYGAFLLCAVLYLSLFLLLAIAVSALTRDSSSSVVLLVIFWAMAIVIVPQVSSIIGVQAVPIPFDANQKHWDYMREVRGNLESDDIVLRGRVEGAPDEYARERRYARRMAEAEHVATQMWWDLEEKLKRQYQVARLVNLISPGYAFQYSVEALLGAGVMRRDWTMERSWEYRMELREALRELDATDPESPHILHYGDYMSQRPLDSRTIPRLQFGRVPRDARVSAGIVPMVILSLEVAAAFFFALWAVNRTAVAER